MGKYEKMPIKLEKNIKKWYIIRANIV